MAHKAKSPLAATSGPCNCDCLEAVTCKIIPPKQDLQALLPSRAALARKWPSLKLNRYTGAWRDDATGATGDNIASLLVFLNEGGSAQ